MEWIILLVSLITLYFLFVLAMMSLCFGAIGVYVKAKVRYYLPWFFPAVAPNQENQAANNGVNDR